MSVLAGTGPSGRASVLGVLGFLALIVLGSPGSSELLVGSSQGVLGAPPRLESAACLPGRSDLPSCVCKNYAPNLCGFLFVFFP